MKRCPQCGQTYTDELMRFCLNDGTPLIDVFPDTEEPTLVKPTIAAVPPPARRGVSPWFKYLALALLVFLLGGAVAVFFAVKSLWPERAANRSNVSLASPSPEGSGPSGKGSNVSPTPSPSATPTPARTTQSPTPGPDEDEKPQKLPDPTPSREPDRPGPFIDPQTARISFSRGSVGETVSGRIARQRRFVLTTMSGQTLTARVRSQNGCVTFPNGARRAAQPTSSGDTYLTLENNCDEPVNFRMAVTVR